MWETHLFRRVSYFVDGLNLDHQLRKHGLSWLNLTSFLQSVMMDSEELVRINYFTAVCHWDRTIAKAQKTYLAVLRDNGIRVVLGQFLPVTRYYVKGRTTLLPDSSQPATILPDDLPERIGFRSYTEKTSDVALGVELYDSAANDEFDRAVIVSGDSDLVPAIKMVRKRFPLKQLTSFTCTSNSAKRTRQQCHESIRFSVDQVRQFQFGSDVQLRNGKTLHRPESWLQPGTLSEPE